MKKFLISFLLCIAMFALVSCAGLDGNGIQSIQKTNTNGLVDTYTITYTDGETSTFTVTNGKDGIDGIDGTKGEDGHTPVITIQNGNWYIDGVDTQVKAEGVKGDTGNGISSISKTSTQGLVDTYTITYTNGDTQTFSVTNGQDGQTPTIGQNGNWFVGETDTGFPAKGDKGEKGLSAYELYCKYYNYSGTEKEWVDDLIKGNLSNPDKPQKKLTIAVYGDSISTKAGRNAVEIKISEKDVGVELSAYVTIHDVGTVINGYQIKEGDIGKELCFTPTVADVGKTIGNVANYNPGNIKTWWEHLEEYYNCNINPVCWSSSSYCSHENNIPRLVNSYSWHDSQIRKLGTRIEGSMERIAPDIVILYRGCNDMTHSPYAKLTEGYFDNVDWKYPENDLVEGGYGVKEALSLTIKKIRDTYPNAKIVIATQANFKRIDCDNFPVNNNLYSLPQFNQALREVADFFGCHTIDFDKCGITYENCYVQGYMTDSSSNPTHPNNLGHKVMGEQAIYDLMYKLHIKPYVERISVENVLYEKTALNYVSGNFYSDANYYSYDFVPVESGKTYYMPNCRNTALLDANGNFIKGVYGPDMESNGFYLTIPNGVCYLRTCARYDTVAVENFKITEVGQTNS